jgi:hypothetical protein
MIMPIDFNKIGPRSHAKVLTKPNPAGAITDRQQIGPAANPRVKSVGSNYPSAAHSPAFDPHPRRIESFHPRLPARYDAGIFRAFHEDPMEQSSANTQAEILSFWK